jgi:hypothetical protein
MTSYELMRTALLLFMRSVNPNDPDCMDKFHAWQTLLQSRYSEQCNQDSDCSLWVEHGQLLCPPR